MSGELIASFIVVAFFGAILYAAYTYNKVVAKIESARSEWKQ